MKKSSEQISVVYKYCNECYGILEFSHCCEDDIINGKCCICGKFCKKYNCRECGGFSPIEIKVGDEVEVYVYRNSPSYLKDQFSGARYAKGRFYRGRVKFIIDKETVSVKLSNRCIAVKIDDIDIN